MQMTDTDAAAKLAMLMEWFHRHGGRANGVEVRCQDGTRGMFATRDIAVDEPVVQVPPCLMIGPEVVRSGRLARHLEKEGIKLDDGALQALFLIETRRHGGFWTPYIDVVPQSYRGDIPVLFDKQHAPLLQGSEVHDATRRMFRQLRTEFRKLRRSLPAADRISLSEFAWARLCAKTRSFTLKMKDRSDSSCLVPFADMMNHRWRSPTWWKAEEAGFEASATKPFTAGDPVPLSYGTRTNATLMSLYGFALEKNPDDRVSVYVDLPKDHFTFDVLSRPYRDERGYELQLSAQYARDFNRRSFSILRVSSLPDSAAAYDHPATVARTADERWPPLSVENECETLRRLSAACEKRLAEFPDPIERDDELLAAGTLTAAQRFAVITRRGEKHLLHEHIALARRTLPVLTLPPQERDNALTQLAIAGGPYAGYFAELPGFLRLRETTPA